MIPFLAGAALSAGASLLLAHLHEEQETGQQVDHLLEMVNAEEPPSTWVFKSPNLLGGSSWKVIKRAAKDEHFAAWFLAAWGGRIDFLGDDPVIVLAPHRVSHSRLNSRCRIDPEGVVRYLPHETPVGWYTGDPSRVVRCKHSFLVAAERWRRARVSREEASSDS